MLGADSELKQSLENLSLNSLNNSLSIGSEDQDDDSYEHSTPCKSTNKTVGRCFNSTPLSTTTSSYSGKKSPSSAVSITSIDKYSSGKKRIHTNLNSMKNLPPLRPVSQSGASIASSEDFDRSSSPNNASKANSSKMELGTPQKPAWNNSFVKKEPSNIQDKRLPWSSDIRMRKSSVTTSLSANTNNNIAASPRTPHISQVNVKRQKQKSQLSRVPIVLQTSTKSTSTANTSDTIPIKKNDGFAMPLIPAHKPPVTDNQKKQQLEDMVNSLRQKYEEELKAKSAMETKYLQEQKARIKLEMDHKLLMKKCASIEAELDHIKKQVEFREE